MQDYLKVLRKDIREILYLKEVLPNEKLESALPELIETIVIATLCYIDDIKEENFDYENIVRDITIKEESNENISKYFEYTEKQECPKCNTIPKQYKDNNIKNSSSDLKKEWKEAHVCIKCGRKYWFWNGSF